MSEEDSFLKKLKRLTPRNMSPAKTPNKTPDKTPNKTPNKTPPKTPKLKNKHSYSLVSLSEVTEGALQVWRALPEKIRQDPSLASFRQEHERLHGESLYCFY